MDTIDILVIGNGVAGVSAALAARRHPALAADARIALACPEPEDFYYRAALTNFLLGEMSRDELSGLPHGTLKQQRIERLHDTATRLDAQRRVVTFASGLQLGYRRLLLACGASARQPTADFANARGAFALRTLADATALLAHLPDTRRAIVLGGGILGLEVLEALHQRGVRVQLLHRGRQLLDRVVDATGADLIRRRIEADNVGVRLDARVAGLDAAGGMVRGVQLEDGTRLPADMVVGCVGTLPNTAWLRDSGVLLTDAGLIRVDRQLAVPGLEGVFAAGDVAAVVQEDLPFANPGGLWQPARYQGRVAGRNLAQADGAQHVAYSPGILLNSTRAWGMAVESAGAHPGTPGLERVAASGVDERGTVHKVAVFSDERLAGFALVGDRREARSLALLLDLRDAPIVPAALRARLFDPAFDLHAWVAAQAAAAGPARFSQRDDDRLTVEAPGGAARAAAPISIGTTLLGRPPSGTPAQRPLRLLVGDRAETLTEGPAWIGAHAQARWARDESLPRDAALSLEPMGLAWIATTTQATAAIRINGVVLRKPQFLGDNDVIEVGRWRALVQPAESAPAPADTGAARAGWLVGPVHRFALVADGTTRIGRQPENDLVIDRAGIGNFHAQIIAERGRWLLVDSGSPEGIVVNDRADADFLPLQHGDRVRLGADTWRFELTDAPAVASTAGVAGYLCPENGPDAGSALAVRLRNGQAIVGRGDAADVRLADPLVSRRHALVRAIGGGLELLDYGSANGVLVNGQRVEADRPWRLQDGNELRLGAYSYRFSTALPTGRRIASAASGASELGSTVLARRAPAAPATPPPLRLVVRPNAMFPMLANAELDGSQALRIGRVPKGAPGVNGLVIPAITISREHAEIAPENGRWIVRDLGSREGTLRNHEPVGAEGVPLGDGDELVFGHVATFDVHIDADAAALAPGRPASRMLSRQPVSSAFWLAAPNALDGDLRAMVETELDACIGCHACMRACPLPDAGNVSIAALNQSAASGRISDPRARRFVQDCTQCQQCVPVCPVNIQRSRIVLWNKLKLDVDADYRPPLQLGEGAAAMDETVAQLSRTHADHELLGVLLERDRQELLSRCQYRLLSDGEVLVGQGSYVSTLWIVHRGEVDWELPTESGMVGSLRLGEGKTIALREFVADEICDRSARAVGQVTAIGISRALVSQFARRCPALRDVLTRLASEHDLFARVPGLAKLSDADKALLQRDAEVALATPGEALRGFGAGEQGALVVRGFVAELSAPGQDAVRAYHRQGALLRLGGKAAPPRYQAKTACELLLLPPSIEARLRALMPASGPDAVGGALALLPSGKRIMAIDVTKCVDCNNCVDACGRRHGHSRLDRHKQGIQVGVHHIPSACYHCEDPKCLLCDTGGIVRTEGGEIRIIEENCIGCGSCASRCPYDNISMVSREQPAAAGVVSSLLQLLGLAKPELAEAADGARIAVKCDLCVDHADGPACVRACPTGAAQRLSLAEIAAGAEDGE